MMNEKEKWFERWFDSPYYSILYKNRTKDEAVNFVDVLMKYLQPARQSRFLDIACGKGRYTIQLSKYGAEVIGIDISLPRIEAAKTKANEKVSFFVHDMRKPFRNNYFDYAFNFFTSFGYFDTHQEHIDAARSFALALKPGGMLVVDYFNSIYVKRNLVTQTQIVSEGIIFDINKEIKEGKINKHISFKDKDGKGYRYKEEVADLGLEDLKKIFGIAGLELIQVFGDYHLQDFVPETSSRLIMIFKK